jgi:hypothetical protein
VRPVETILAAVEGLPAVKVQINDAAEEAGIRVGARVVARVDLRGSGGVLVELPPERIPTLQAVYPSCRPTADGIVFDLADPQGASEAIAAIRRRVNVERLIWQFQVASP